MSPLQVTRNTESDCKDRLKIRTTETRISSGRTINSYDRSVLLLSLNFSFGVKKTRNLSSDLRTART